MARRTISDLQDQLDAERADNERLYTKVENLRAELANDDEDEDEAEEESDEDEEEAA